jgi:hypothetical protein
MFPCTAEGVRFEFNENEGIYDKEFGTVDVPFDRTHDSPSEFEQYLKLMGKDE